MGPNYNIHGTADDEYYYCPNNDCACNGSSNHRGNDDYDYDKHNLAASGDYNNYCCGHCGAFYNAYDDPTCDDCGAPADFSSSYNYFKSVFPDNFDDLAKHYDNIFGTYDDSAYYHGAYRLAYDEYQSAKRRNNESGEPYIRYI
jgi:hypothetical protein